MIKLLNTKVSSHCLYPEDEVFVECTFEALEDRPINESVELFCDFVFGHMTIPANRATSHRVKTRIYPQPLLWKKGDVITTGTRWKIPGGTYGGSFGLNIGICNEDTVPLDFVANGKTVKRQYVGDIEVAFEGCSPKFVNSHRDELFFEFEKTKITNKNDSQPILFETAEIVIRDKQSDGTIIDLKALDNGHCSNDFVSFDVKSEQNENSINITLENVCEKDGYELLEVKFPTIVAEKNSKMITTFMGGRKIDSKMVYAWGYEQKYYQRNVAVIESENQFTVVEAPFLDDKLHHSVYEKNGERYSSVGVTFTYRMRAYGKLESVRVINIPTLCIYNANSMSNVLTYLRKDLKKKTHMYDRALFYYFHIECDGFDEIATFKDALERVKELYYLTGGVKQFMILRGWQHEGHDTGYPDVFKVNKTGGTLEDLKNLITEARKYNAVVTFHDNFDDMYEENGYFDSDIVAKDGYGNNFKSWIWVSGISNMTSFPKLVKSGKMAERIKKTLEMYPVKDSYYLDVLSCEVKRYDYSPDVCMAAQEVLEYKKAVVAEFEKYGMSIVSEAVSQPFAGVIGHAWGIGYTSAEKLFSEDEQFPLLPMIFHGILPYSGGDDVNAIVAGSTIIPGMMGSLGNYKEIYYLHTFPILYLCNNTIESYEHDGDIYKTVYDNGAVISYDARENDIEIKVRDNYIVKNSNTLAEGYNSGEYIGYTKNGDFQMKKYFKEEIMEIKEIAENGKKLTYRIDNDILYIDAKENTAFKIIIK